MRFLSIFVGCLLPCGFLAAVAVSIQNPPSRGLMLFSYSTLLCCVLFMLVLLHLSREGRRIKFLVKNSEPFLAEIETVVRSAGTRSIVVRDLDSQASRYRFVFGPKARAESGMRVVMARNLTTGETHLFGPIHFEFAKIIGRADVAGLRNKADLINVGGLATPIVSRAIVANQGE